MSLSTVDPSEMYSPPSKVTFHQLAMVESRIVLISNVSQRRTFLTRSTLPGVGVKLMANLHDTVSERIHDDDVAWHWFRFQINYKALNIYNPRNECIHAGRCVSRILDVPQTCIIEPIIIRVN